MKNKIEDLRNHLFATIEALQDTENPMALDRAKAISDVAQTIINTAKVEVDFMKVSDRIIDTGFLPNAGRLPAPDKDVDFQQAGKTVHRIK